MLGLTLPKLASTIPLSVTRYGPDGGALRAALYQRAVRGQQIPTRTALKRAEGKVDAALADLIHSKRRFPHLTPAGNVTLRVDRGENRNADMYYSDTWAEEEATIACEADDEITKIHIAPFLHTMHEKLGTAIAAAFMNTLGDLSAASHFTILTPDSLANMLEEGGPWMEVEENLSKFLVPDLDGGYEEQDRKVIEIFAKRGYDTDSITLPSSVVREIGGGLPTEVWLNPKAGPLPTVKQLQRCGLRKASAERLVAVLENIQQHAKLVPKVLNRRKHEYAASSYSLVAVAMLNQDSDLAWHLVDDHINCRMEVGDPNITLALSASALNHQSKKPGDPLVAMAAHLDSLGLIGELAECLE